MATHSRTRLRALGLVAALTLVVTVSLTVYGGLTDAFVQQLRYGGMRETRNVALSLLYWIGQIGELRWDEATGQWALPVPGTATGRNDVPLQAFHTGDFAAAVRALEDEDEADGTGADRDRLFWLALSYLRYGEAANCLDRLRRGGGGADHTTVCSLPLAHLHDQQQGSSRAIDIFERLLDDGDRDEALIRWLLNLAHLTLSGDPLTVPVQHRAGDKFMDLFYGPDGDEIADRFQHLSFVDRAVALGVDTFDAGKGVAVEDFDNDGDLDLVTGGTFDLLHYYENRGAAGFADRTGPAGLDGVAQSHILTAADYDNDGWIDLFVGSLFQPDRLWRNVGLGSFRDVTDQAGLGIAPAELTFSWASSWGDIDLDGDLDLFVARWGTRAPFLSGVMAKTRLDSRLYLNQSGAFVDVTDEWGLERVVGDRAYVGAAFGDADDDGDADLFLSSPMQGRSVLLRNDRGAFAAEQWFGAGFVATFLDVDHDGHLELFQGGLADARTSVRKTVFDESIGSPTSGRSRIHRREADGTWVLIDGYFESELPMGTMGASFGDLDNDGCHDFYLGTGGPEPWFILPNLMYAGRADGAGCALRATNISMLEGFGTLQKGHGIVFFDHDNDGDQDIYSSLGGMWPGDRWPNQLLVNESDLGRRWLKIRLRGRATNRFGVGATIRVVALDDAGSRIVRTHHMDHKTAFGSAPYLAHVGLLDATRVETVEVTWPVSGCRARYAAELDRMNVLDEGACDPPTGP